MKIVLEPRLLHPPLVKTSAHVVILIPFFYLLHFNFIAAAGNFQFALHTGIFFWHPQNLVWNSTQNLFEHYLRNFYPFLTLISYICCILIQHEGYFEIKVSQLHFVCFPELLRKWMYILTILWQKLKNS